MIKSCLGTPGTVEPVPLLEPAVTAAGQSLRNPAGEPFLKNFPLAFLGVSTTIHAA